MKKYLWLLLLLPTSVLAQNQARMISGTNNITTCPYVIAKQDVTKLDVFITSSACAVTLPAATTNGFGKGSIFSVKNNGTGSVTITIGGGESIDGNPSVTLLPGAGMDIYSTGTGYSSQAGAGGGGGGGGGINPPAGDIGGNAVVPLVISTHLNSPLPILQGGTGTQTPALVAGTGVTITGSWPNNTINATSACWQNNGSSLTCEPFSNAVPPLVATLNVGNSTIDLTCPAAVGVGGSHASGCVPDPGASGTTTDYLGRDMAYHTAVGASTILPDPATSIQYVAGTCNGGSACTDANNGLSWGAAKLTISAAIQALPGGGGGTAGTGTVFVANGAVKNAAGSQYGIWLMASADPNFGSPPTGWLKCTQGGGGCNLSIIGIANSSPSPNGHDPRVFINSGGGAGPTTPDIWLSDVSSIQFANMQFQYPGRAFVIGECSDGTRTGTCPVTGVTFKNVGALLNQIAANGPCTDITGQSYWLWFKDFGCGGNAYQASGGYTANAASAFLVDGATNQGNGLIVINDSNFAGGGVKFINGANGGSIYIYNITEEGDFTDQIPPAVWFTGYGAATDAILSNIQIADAGAAGSPVVQNDGTQNGIGPTVMNTEGSSGIAIVGPAHVVNQPQFSLVNQTSSPRSQYQTGFFAGWSIGETDVARRIGGLTPTRFRNTGIFSSPLGSPAPWAVTSFGGTSTLTTGVTDPFGGTGAATATATSATDQQLTFNSGNVSPGCTAYTPVSGDWIVIGVWLKQVVVPSSGATIVFSTCGGSPPTTSKSYFSGQMVKGDGQWSWVWSAYKVSSGALIGLNATIHFNSSSPATVFAPTLNVITTGTLSDNEVLEYAASMGSIDNACPVGSICNVAGHPVNADTFSIRNGNSLKISAASVAADRTITAPDPLGSAALPLMTGSITNGNNVCASGTAGLITTVGCTGGGGGAGTVDPALQFSMTYYNTAGTVAHVGGVAGPTGPVSVPSFWVTIPNSTGGGQATAPQPILAGIPGRTVSGASDTVLVTDRVSTVTYTNAGATAVSLPGAGTTGFGSNFCFKMKVQGSSAVATITPAAGTINGGATQTVLQGQQALVCSFDNSNYIATIADPPAAAGSNIALTRGDSSLSFASSAGGGTLTNAANSLPATQLICGNTYPDTLKCNLSGDASTTNSAVVTNTGINGTAVTGTSGNVTKFGASNTLVDSAIAASNLVTAASAYTSGDLVKAAASDKTTSDSGILATNVVTSTSNAGFANQICGSASTNKVCAFQSLSDLSSTDYTGATTGAVNALAGCPTNTATALTAGMMVAFLPNLANTTTTPTLNLCTLGAKTITKLGTAALVANDLITTAIAVARYDGTGWELQNPQTASGGGSSALSSITAAAATNTIANGNNPQVWNWAQTTNSQDAFRFGETSVATNGTVTGNLAQQTELKTATGTASTATPLSVLQGSVTGSLAIPAAQIKTTWNGSSLYRGLVLSVTDTAHGAGSNAFQIFGGSGGTTSIAAVDPSGNLTVNSCTGCTGNPVVRFTEIDFDYWSGNVFSWPTGALTTTVCTTPTTTAPTNAKFGYENCATGITANTLQVYGNANGSSYVFGNAANPTNLDLVCQGGVNSTTSVRFMCKMGTTALSSSNNDGAGSMAGIRYSTNASDTNYMAVLCNAGTCNATSTGIAATTTPHTFEIRMDDVNGCATFLVDNSITNSCLSTDYPPTTGLAQYGMIADNLTTTSISGQFARAYIATTVVGK